MPVFSAPSSVVAPRGAPDDVPLVLAEGIEVRLGGSLVLRDVDLGLGAGEAVALTGPNGSGKSTLLRVLATLLRPTAGRLQVLGCAWPRCTDAAVRRQITLVGHEAALHPALTVTENLALVADLLGRDHDVVDEALADVGLTGAADRPVRICSQGMTRRAELARAIICRPRLLLLDEAHAALDVDARALVGAVTRRVTDAGGAAVLVTHDVDALAGDVARVLAVRGGRLDDVERC